MFPKKSPYQWETEARNKQISPTDYAKSTEDIRRRLYCLCLYSFLHLKTVTAPHSSIP